MVTEGLDWYNMDMFIFGEFRLSDCIYEVVKSEYGLDCFQVSLTSNRTIVCLNIFRVLLWCNDFQKIEPKPLYLDFKINIIFSPCLWFFLI